ncbi:hypothetical protein CLAFUW4_10924 [Fulvia fulva]|uniref:F-box domain-containing protein n=1 Tax=Passalora fulva TaxID=5499 RepID=A0A9Q8PCS5_PASFU|nr:uncharacterized protein CLAFUR5_09966 [Fulvia fulva]KAK4620083.1 hypothetical protein CLAFUR4_10929 [Fulvia fulva]KAK4620926.1 hypothetical protein CLAFUR0_10936 [Fulvia fulva]UJO20042.1 hypothetical protein CLAFUR5_09966 [Fulvia fulva]WPV16921.1 hypothetical protein CLAFUW4_10924 [Fulvia fulva]WPV31959.1 hypothetical protein CLAFUW7_10922 [Fulvia fulva]
MAETNTDSACARVLGTVELLENILIYLPTTDVVRYRRVHSIWQAAINGSPPRRRHVFLDPSPITQIFTLKKTFVQVHPLLADAAKLHFGCDSISFEFDIDIVKLSTLPGLEWRTMLATSPPASETEILVSTYSDEALREIWVEITMPPRGGVTLGRLYDSLREHDSRPVSAETSEAVVAWARAWALKVAEGSGA